MRISREETFGPVVCIMKCKDNEEALKRANDTEYGLVSGLFTKDTSESIDLSNRLEAGTVFVNNYFTLSAMAPFGGWKCSGIGSELGKRHVEAFLKEKTVHIQH